MTPRDGAIGSAERTRASHPFPMHDGRSVADLLRELSTETVELIQQELALAKAEMRRKVDVYQRTTLSMGIGAILLVAALLTALWAVNLGLTALLAQWMDLDVAVWLSPLLLSFALAAIGWGMIKAAKERFGDEGLAPRQTTDALREDARWAKEKMHDIKEDIAHAR